MLGFPVAKRNAGRPRKRKVAGLCPAESESKPMLTVYVVLIEESRSDTEVHLFREKEAAIAYAMAEVRSHKSGYTEKKVEDNILHIEYITAYSLENYISVIERQVY